MATNYSDFYRQYVEEKQSATIDDRADDNGWFHCVCPMHPQTSDKKDAGIHEVSGVLHCFVEDRVWTPAEFLHDYMEYDYKEADEIVAFFQAEHSLMKQEGNFTKTFSGYKPKFEALHLKSIDLMSEEHHVVREYMRARGIYYKTLLKYNVGYLPKELNGWGRDCLVFPYFHAGRVVALRYRDVGGNKGAEPGSFMTLWNLDKLVEGTRIAVICEGESDCIRTAQALGDDYVCVSAPQAIFRAEWKREFSNVSQVIIIPQDDAPSKKMANDAKTHLDGIKVVNLPWGPREYGKDTVDWLRYHSDQELLDLVQGSISRRIQTVMDGVTFLEESKKPREWMIEGLLSRGQICMLAGPPKSAKCTSYDTIIELTDGSQVEAKDLIGKRFEIQSFNFHTLGTRPSKAFATDNGFKMCYKIATETGKVLKRTGNHPLIAKKNLVSITWSGCKAYNRYLSTGYKWKNCEDLLEGEFILTPTYSLNTGRPYKSVQDWIVDGCYSNEVDGFQWEQIESIEVIENEPTVAICVPGDNTYITPDACEHNTFLALNLVRSLMNGDSFLGMKMFKPVIDPESLYRVLIWEEEGPLEELRERYEKVFRDTNWIQQVYTAHQLGLKLDEDRWIERLVKEIEQKRIDLLVIDPFSRCYGVDDENSASQMGQVWSRIASIMNRFPRLSIVILHHFSKSGNIEDGGKSMRGSSRSHGEYDLGILTGASKTSGMFKVGFEARSIPQPTDSAGNKVFTLELKDGILVEASQSTASASALPEIERPLGNRGLKSIMAEKGVWGLADAAEYYQTTTKTINTWIDRSVDPQTGKPLMIRTKPSKGNPVQIQWIGYSQEFENPEDTD